MKKSASVVKNHHTNYEENNGLDAKIYMLKIADDFDKLMNKKLEFNEKPLIPTEVFAIMEKDKGMKYHPGLFDDFKRMMLVDLKLDIFMKERKIGIIELEPGLVLSRPLFTEAGKMLLNSEYILDKPVIIRIFDHNKVTPIKEPIFVYDKKPDKPFNLQEILKIK